MEKRVIRRPDLRAATGLGVTKIYEMIGEAKFPRPIPLGGRAVGWLADEVDSWLAARKAERDAKGKAA
jgi:prophage regulatory protein